MGVNLTLTIGIEGKDNASAKIKAVGELTANLAEKITAFSEAWRTFGEKLASVIEEPFKKAIEAESQNNLLASSMKVLGAYTDEAYESILKFADALKVAGGQDDDLIKKIVTTNLQMGMNVDQAEAAAQAAIGLANAHKINLVEANNLLIGTLEGVDRQLKKMDPDIGSLTVAAERHGAAIEIIGKKYRQFVTSDASTTEGAMRRLKLIFDDISKSLASAFLQGAGVGSNVGVLVDFMERLSATITRAEPEIKKFGELLSGTALAGLEKLANNLGAIVAAGNAIVWIFEKVNNIFNMFSGFLNAIIYFAANAALELKTLVGVFSDLASYDFKGAKKQLDDLKNSQDYLNASSDANARMVLNQTKALLGLGEAAEKTKNKLGGQEIGPVSERGIGTINRKNSREQDQLEIQAQRSLMEQVYKINSESRNEIISNYAESLRKIQYAEEKAARDGVNITREANLLKQALHDQLQMHLADAYTANRLAAAKAAGDTTATIQHELEQQLIDYRKLREQEKMTDEEYVAAVLEAQRKAGEAQQQTTGSVAMDEATTKATSLVNSVNGGLNSIIGNIGAMFGPVGSLVSSIIQLFNQTPAQFQKMIQGLIKAIVDLPTFIRANVPYMIAAVIQAIPKMVIVAIQELILKMPAFILNIISSLLETIPQVLGKLFSLGFWSSMANEAFKAFMQAFKNFWSLLFTGKAINSALTPALDQVKSEAKFGSDNPDAAGSEFKIRDANLRNQRRAGTFQDQFSNAVDDGGKSLTQMLMDAWHAIIDMLQHWFDTFVAGIRDVWLWVYDHVITPIISGIKAIWNWVFDMFTAAMTAVGQAFQWVWSNVLSPMITGVKAAFQWIWDTFLAPYINGVKAIFQWVWDNILNPYIAAVKAVFQWVWDKIFSPIISGIKSATSTLSNVINSIINFKWPSLPDMPTIPTPTWLQDFINAVNSLTSFHFDTGGLVGKLGTVGGTAQSAGSVASQVYHSTFHVGYAKGGPVYASSGLFVPRGTDTVPAMLTPGEFVLTEPTVSRLGVGVLDALNRGASIGSPAPQGGGSPVILTLNFNVAAGAKIDKDAVRAFMPEVITILNRESRRGTLILDKRGVS